MKKIIVASVLIFSLFGLSTPVLAQTTQIKTTAPEQDPESIPGVTSLFFRGLSQRLRLVFTFDSVADAALRLEFAKDNLDLANFISANTSDDDIRERATTLVKRADELIGSINQRREDWSKGDEGARDEFIDKVQVYQTVSVDLVNSIMKNTASEQSREDLRKIVEKLENEQSELVKYIQIEFADTVEAIKKEAGVKVRTDRDRDGLDDEQEADLGLSNDDYDTDGDGLADRAEIEQFGTDPNNVDSDGDGFRDGLELLEGFNPVGSGAYTAGAAVKSNLIFLNQAKTRATLKPETLQYINTAIQNYQVNQP